MTQCHRYLLLFFSSSLPPIYLYTIFRFVVSRKNGSTPPFDLSHLRTFVDGATGCVVVGPCSNGTRKSKRDEEGEERVNQIRGIWARSVPRAFRAIPVEKGCEKTRPGAFFFFFFFVFVFFFSSASLEPGGYRGRICLIKGRKLSYTRAFYSNPLPSPSLLSPPPPSLSLSSRGSSRGIGLEYSR